MEQRMRFWKSITRRYIFYKSTLLVVIIPILIIGSCTSENSDSSSQNQTINHLHENTENVWSENRNTIVGKALGTTRSEEHTSELQSRPHLVCRLLLEKKKKTK